MKTNYTKVAYCTILLFIVNITIFSQETWTWSYPAPQGNNLNSVSWVSGSIFVAVGDYGTILRTTNDGTDWSVISSGTTTKLNKVHFCSAETGFSVGQAGIILKTSNGGSDWTSLSFPDATNLTSLYFTDVLTGFVGNALGAIYKTTNGGSNWVSQTPAGGAISSIMFVNANQGFAGSADGNLFKTTDAGLTWSSLAASSAIVDVKFTDALNGWYVNGTNLYKTTNGGSSWEIPISLNGETAAMAISSNNIFTAGNLKYIDKFTVGGSFISTTSSGSGYLNSLAVNNGSIVVAVGTGGNIFISTDDGTNWTSCLATPNDLTLSTMFQNPNGQIFAAGSSGSIIKSTDSGVSWSSVTSGATAAINKIFFLNEDDGWFVAGKYLFITADGGTTWSIQYTNSISTYAHLDVRFFDATSGITIARNSTSTSGFVYYTTNGSTWVQGTATSAPTMHSIAYLDSKDQAFLCGNNGKLLKTTNAGANWSTVASGTSNNLYSIYFVSPLIGYVAGAGGTILKTADGGANWNPQTSGTVQDLSDIRFYNELHGIASGNNGTVIMTNNGGDTWTQKSLPTNNNLNEAVIINETTAFIVGTNTTILKGANLPLPVELTIFTASVRNNMVNLNWETATEIDNYGFDIERKDKNSDWIKIGFIEGHTTSNSPKYYSFSDKPTGSTKFSYRLKQIDNDGKFEYSNEVEVLIDNLPDGYLLEQNYPNPFNPETSIRFVLKENTKATLKVYNALGELGTTLFDGIADAGRYYDIKFNGNNLSSGVYIYTLDAGKYHQTRKMMLMK